MKFDHVLLRHQHQHVADPHTDTYRAVPMLAERLQILVPFLPGLELDLGATLLKRSFARSSFLALKRDHDSSQSHRALVASMVQPGIFGAK